MYDHKGANQSFYLGYVNQINQGSPEKNVFPNRCPAQPCLGIPLGLIRPGWPSASKGSHPSDGFTVKESTASIPWPQNAWIAGSWPCVWELLSRVPPIVQTPFGLTPSVATVDRL